VLTNAAGAIRRYAPRAFTGSSVVNPMTASARNASAAPTQPTEDVMCVVNVNRRKAGVIMFEGPWADSHSRDILANAELNDG